MRANVRDAIVVTVLLAALVAARLAWHRISPWGSLAILFAAALAAVVIYRFQGAPQPPSEQLEHEQVSLLQRQD